MKVYSDFLLEMFHNPGGDWHPGQGDNPIYMGVSKNRGGPPKSSILIGFSIINHPFWGVLPLFLGQHPYNSCQLIGIPCDPHLSPTVSEFFFGFRVTRRWRCLHQPGRSSGVEDGNIEAYNPLK